MNTPKKKLAFIYGTRPELIKIAPLIKACSENYEPIVINTGQHKELLELEANKLYNWFNFQATYNLDVMRDNQNPQGVIASILKSLESLLIDCHGVVVQGDTASAFAGGFSGFLNKISIFHLEAGLRSFNLEHPFPEEGFRRCLSQIASVHLCPTPKAVNNLKQENITQDVYCVGNTVIDALKYTINQIQSPLFPDLKNLKFIYMTMHRRENTGDPYKQVSEAAKQILDEHPDLYLVFPVHPRPSVRQAIEPILKNHKRVFLLDPVDYLSSSWLLANCFLVLTDSGGLQEEACYLGKPTLILREVTEREEAIEAGTAKLVGTETRSVYENLKILLNNPEIYKSMNIPSDAFGTGNSSEKILEIIKQKI